MPLRSIFISIACASTALVGAATLANNASPADIRAAYARPNPIDLQLEHADTDAKRKLGKALFFDTRFSGSQTLSCASCHEPEYSWTDAKARAQGEGRAPLAYRSPTLLNVGYLDRLGWDGKFRSLEAVTFAPITGSANMNLPEHVLIDRLSTDEIYVKAFAEAFDDKKLNRSNIESALAAYERTLISGPAPFDRYIEGDAAALTPSALRGFELFQGKAQCSSCHSGWAFTDGSFHDIGTAVGSDVGRGRIFPTSVQLQYAFKTPTLRNVAIRAPYMHDGSISTLRDVIDLYDRGGIDRPSRSVHIKPLGLSDTEKSDLISFLKSLTEDTAPIAADATKR